MRPIRLDDVGASSKQYEWWSRHRWANIWPLHSRHFFGAWGPYRELTADELDRIASLVAFHGSVITFAITAYWVDHGGTRHAYATRFPAQAAMIRWWVRRGVVEPAAHGLYHCIPGHHRPHWLGGNRPWHREPVTDPIVACAALSWSLDLPVRRYVAPGEPAGTTEERVFHDREFVLDWNGTMRALEGAL